MKIDRMTVAALLVFSYVSFGYTQTSVTQEDENTNRFVCSLISGNRAGIITSMDEKRISQLGDRASSAVTKCIANRQISVKETKNILAIVHRAFAAPSLIASSSDRAPNATLPLLNHLHSVAHSKDVSSRIDDEIKFVQASNTSGRF